MLTITANNQTVSYGTPVATVTGAGSYIPTGFVNGESASVIGGSATYTTTYTATTAAATAGVTITPVVTGLTATNYSFSPANGTITIEKAVLTITANNQTVSYGTPVATVTGAGSYIPTGFVNGESASVIGGSATYTTTYTATTAAATAGVTITPVVTGLTATNYSFSPANGTITIEKAVLTITANNQTVSYGTSCCNGNRSGIIYPDRFCKWRKRFCDWRVGHIHNNLHRNNSSSNRWGDNHPCCYRLNGHQLQLLSGQRNHYN